MPLRDKLLSRYLDEYSTDQMRAYLELLVDWRDMDRERIPRYEIDRIREELDSARRAIKHFFFKAQRLNNAGHADDPFMKEICGLAGFELLFDVIEPLEREGGKSTQAGDEIYEQLGKRLTN